MRFVLVCLLVCAAGCGGGRRGDAARPGPVERRVVTSGAELLATVPEGADAVLELDVARLRGNQVVGASVRALSPWLRERAAASALPVDLPLDADLVVAAVYDLAGADAAMLVLVRGTAIDAAAVTAAAPDTALVDAHTFAFGPPALRARVDQVAHEQARAITADGAFLRLRDTAMPLRAPGASLRLTARLSPRARVAAAGRLAYDGALPASISLWADVADDFALVALLDTDSAAEALELAADIDDGVKRAGRLLAIPLALRRIRATPGESSVRLIWTIGPRALKGVGATHGG